MDETAADDKLWVHDRFEPGAELGRWQVALDRRRIELWNGLYSSAHPTSDDAASVPEGLVVAAMMEAYIKAIQPRPPGNVHASQSLRFRAEPPPAGTLLTFTFRCQDKWVRKDRKWIAIAVEIARDDTPVADGLITTIWSR